MQRMIDIVKRHKVTIIFALLFLFSSLTKTLLYFKLIHYTPNGWATLNNIIITALISIIIIGVTYLFTSKKFPIFLLIWDVIISTIVLGDIMFLKYYGSPFTVDLIYQANLLFENNMGGSVNALFQKELLLLYIPSVIFLVCVIMSRMYMKVKPVRASWFKRLALSVVVVGVVVFASSAYVGGATLAGRYCDKSVMMKDYGIYLYHGEDLVNSLSNMLVNKKLTDAEKEQILDYYEAHPKVKSDHFGIAKGKNVIAIQLESFQQFIIGTKFHGQEITPNLNKLIKEGLYFDNLYQQTGFGNTSDAERLFHTSNFTDENASANYLYPNNTLHSFAGEMQKQGYATKAFHAYVSYFWNRDICYPHYGFQKFVTRADLPKGKTAGWGLDDHLFFKDSIDLTDTTKPFYSFLISLTSHYPFDYAKDHAFNKAELDGTVMGDYLQCANYVDDAIGKFIQYLKKKDLYDNTVIVLYGDHKAFAEGEFNYVMKVNPKGIDKGKNTEYKFAESLKIPFIILNSGLKSKTVHTVSGQSDMMPTLADIMGVEMPYALGSDILHKKSKDGFAVMRNGSVATDRYFMLSDGKLFSRIDGKEISDPAIAADMKNYLKELNVSDLILKKNAFAQFSLPGVK